MLRKHFVPLTIWTALCLLFFGSLVSGTARLPNSDFSGQFHTFALFQAREMADGRMPLRSPGSYGGFPFAADTQAAVFYPVRLAAVLLSLPWWFSFYALEMEGVFHIWLAGLFTWLLAWDITRSRLAALAAALVFGLGGYLVSYPLLQLALLETIVWLPLVLWLLRRGIARRQRPLPWLLAAGLALGIAALAGHPQTFLHVSYMAAIYYLFLTIRARWDWRWVIGLGALVGLTALGTALIAWLPAWNYLQLTTRSNTDYDFIASGQPLLNYLQIFLPGVRSVWPPEYVTITAVILALFAWLGRRHIPPSSVLRRSEILFWAVTAVIAAWLSLGDAGILFEAVYRAVPGFAFFRQQERLVGLVSFSLALLAGQGLALWLELGAAQRRAITRQIVWITAVVWLVITFTLPFIRPVIAENWPVIWLRQAGITAVALGILWRGGGANKFAATAAKPALRQSQGRLFAGWALLGLIVVELFLGARPALNLQPESPTVFWPQPDWVTQIQADSPGRLDSRGAFHANLGELYGLEDVRGISPLKPRLLEKYEKLPRPLRWQLLNVTHVLAQGPIEPALAELAGPIASPLPGEETAFRLYRFSDALPRAWMVYQPILAADPFAALQDPAFDPAAQVVLPDTAVLPENIAPPATPPVVTVNRPANGRYQLDIITETPGVLIISEWSFPGWQAALNDTPIPLLTANGGLQAVAIPAGRHTLTLTYTLPGLKTGVFLAALVWLAAVLLAWRWRPVIGNRLPVVGNRLPLTGHRLPITDYRLPLTAHRWLCSVLLIVLLGFGLRLFHLGFQELRGEEAFSYLLARVPAAAIIPKLLREGAAHSPTHYLLLHGWMRLAGDSEFSLRFISLLPGVLLIPLMAQLGRAMLHRRVGLLAAFLTAVSPSLVWLSQDTRNQYTLVLFFTALATWLVVRLSNPAQKQSPAGWLVYALTAALAVYIHYYAVFALLAHGVYLLAEAKTRRWFVWWLGAGAAAFLLFIPWGVAVSPGLLAAGQLSSPNPPALAQYLVTIGVESVTGSLLTHPGNRWLFLGALLVAGLGAWRLSHERRAWDVMLLTWLGAATLVIYLARFSRAAFNPFYISVAAPAWLLLLAAGMDVLWGKRRWGRVTAVIALLLLTAVSFFSLYNNYFNPAVSRTQGYRQIAAYVAKQSAPGDLFLAHFPDPSLRYYLRHMDLPYEMAPADPNRPIPEIEAEMAALAEIYDRIWFVPAGTAGDRQDVAHPWLEYHTAQEAVVPAGRLMLYAYRPLPAAPQIWQPIGQTLENGVRLEGAVVTVDGRLLPPDAPLPPGARLRVTLFWRADAPLSESYTAFVHLLAPDGYLLAQHDGIPALGTRPTTAWQPGELILDVHELTLPEDTAVTEARLVVGMYQSDTLERQRFAGGEDVWVIR
ncbi:MAG TPA: DUF2723 domain-containing protein [Anaerolineae bacterium]|nr:DUF2723 domain-containing protein [Anaerolineae bacterium]